MQRRSVGLLPWHKDIADAQGKRQEAKRIGDLIETLGRIDPSLRMSLEVKRGILLQDAEKSLDRFEVSLAKEAVKLTAIRQSKN